MLFHDLEFSSRDAKRQLLPAHPLTVGGVGIAYDAVVLRRRTVFAVLAAVALAPTAGCSAKPEPPRLTPESAKVTSVSPGGLGLDLTLDAFNPNPVALSARSVKARVTLDGKIDLGEVTAPSGIELPAKKSTKVKVPLLVPWQNLAAILGLAASQRDVPYRLQGKLEIGGDSVRFEVPFTLDGTVTHAQLVQITVGAIPGLPGLTAPP